MRFEEIELAWLATEQKLQTSDSRLSMITTYFLVRELILIQSEDLKKELYKLLYYCDLNKISPITIQTMMKAMRGVCSCTFQSGKIGSHQKNRIDRLETMRSKSF